MQADFSTLLAQAGYTVPEAARVLGYSEGHIYRWKRGEEIPRESVIRLLNMEIERRRDTSDAEKTFTFIDLFAGIGGLRRAMGSAGSSSAGI